MKYPVRCRIVDADGQVLAPGLIACTPDISRPHIGKEGIAERIPHGAGIKITLDDGTILFGSQCWWEPIEEEDKNV